MNCYSSILCDRVVEALLDLRSNGVGFDSYGTDWSCTCKSHGPALNPHHLCPPSSWNENLYYRYVNGFSCRICASFSSVPIPVGNWCKVHWTYKDIWTINTCLLLPFSAWTLCNARYLRLSVISFGICLHLGLNESSDWTHLPAQCYPLSHTIIITTAWDSLRANLLLDYCNERRSICDGQPLLLLPHTSG